jgi:hypothetical protein
MKLRCASVAFGAVLVTLAGSPARAQAPAQSPTYIQWSVTGTGTASGRDEAILCSPNSEGGLTIHSMGNWVFDFESPAKTPGEVDAPIKIAAPASVAALHDTNIRTDDHLTGTAKLVIASGGRGQGGIPLLRIRFTATGLRSEMGATGGATGTIVCGVM